MLRDIFSRPASTAPNIRLISGSSPSVFLSVTAGLLALLLLAPAPSHAQDAASKQGAAVTSSAAPKAPAAQPQRRASTASPKAAAKATPPKKASAHPAKDKVIAAPTAGLEGFAANPFVKGAKPVHSLYGGAGKSANLQDFHWTQSPGKIEEFEEKPITVSGKAKTAPESRLQPQQHAPFMGGAHTLPYMDAEKTAELSLEYKVSPKTTTRLVVNPQDPNSPLHRPAEQEKLITSGGLYMDMEVSDNMQFKVGGEYCEIDDSGQYGASRSSQGVAVGVQWNF